MGLLRERIWNSVNGCKSQLIVSLQDNGSLMASKHREHADYLPNYETNYNILRDKIDLDTMFC